MVTLFLLEVNTLHKIYIIRAGDLKLALVNFCGKKKCGVWGTPPTLARLVHLAIGHLLALGDLVEQTTLDRDTQHSGSLLRGGDVGVAEVHHVLRGDGLGCVLVQPQREVLVLHASLGNGSLARLGDAVEHLLQHLADLSVVEVGDGELEGGLAGDGGLGHGDLLSAGRSRGCGVRLFRSPSLTITIRSCAGFVNDFFLFTVHPHFPTVHRPELRDTVRRLFLTVHRQSWNFPGLFMRDVVKFFGRKRPAFLL